MKSINTLIKINKRELDDLRRIAVGYEEELDKMVINNNKMEDDLERESILVAKNPEIGAMFVNYKKLIRDKQEVILKSIEDIGKKLELLKEEITIKFGEVKKFEILLATKLEDERKKALTEETKQLDEIAVNNHLKENPGS